MSVLFPFLFVSVPFGVRLGLQVRAVAFYCAVSLLWSRPSSAALDVIDRRPSIATFDVDFNFCSRAHEYSWFHFIPLYVGWTARVCVCVCVCVC
jgi:hypothetical protein